MRIRKNARWLTQQERENFLKAVLTLKATKLSNNGLQMRLYDFYPLEHRIVRRRRQASNGKSMGDGGHGGPGFAPWHREWLRRFELDLQSVDSSVSLPYWDLCDRRGTQEVLFQPDFMGGDGTGPDLKVLSGYFQEQFTSERPSWWPDEDGAPLEGFNVMRGLTTLPPEGPMNSQPPGFDTTALTREFGSLNILPARDSIRELLRRPNYFGSFSNSFSGPMEAFRYHGPGHGWVGGLMGEPPTSPNDPVFFLHHCGVDMIWALWQITHDQQLPQHRPPLRANGVLFGVRYGHYLEDFMWPWDGILASNSNKAVPPGKEPFPPPDPNMTPPVFPDNAFMRKVPPDDVVRVRDVLDHHNLQDGTGYHYDVEVPYKLEKDGASLAWIEPYFGDLNLTGEKRESTASNPGPNDLVFEMDGTARGWIEAATGDLHVRGVVMAEETDFSDAALQGAIDLRHFNQPLAYIDPAGNFHLKGVIEPNQPAIA